MAKHYPNVWVDLCWAWSIDPYSSTEFVRRFLHAVPSNMEEATRLALGDWCWGRGVELAIEHNLPFKLHTGHHAGTGNMPIDWVRAGNLCPLLARYTSPPASTTASARAASSSDRSSQRSVRQYACCALTATAQAP
jgi:hypothetical protein